MELKPYVHQVQYYETDKMGVTHHANYIRWLEEARIDMLVQMGYPFERMEQEGIVSPITSVSFSYKATTTFPDRVEIRPVVTKFNGVILEVQYTLTRADDGKLVGTAATSSSFLNKEGHFVRLKRDYPQLYQLFQDMVIPETQENA